MEKKFRFKFIKEGSSKYLSHLDVMSLMIRALRRAGIALKYTEGFNQRPKLGFGPPAPLGIESRAEYCDITVVEDITGEEFAHRTNESLIEGIRISDVKQFSGRTASLMSIIDVIDYSICISRRYPAREKSLEIMDSVYNIVDFKGSIYDTVAEEKSGDGKLWIIKLSGFACTSEKGGRKVFRPIQFIEKFKEITANHGLYIEKVVKEEAYALKEGGKLTPFEVL
jgi:radical SAM-linked protein